MKIGYYFQLNIMFSIIVITVWSIPFPLLLGYIGYLIHPWNRYHLLNFHSKKTKKNNNNFFLDIIMQK